MQLNLHCYQLKIDGYNHKMYYKSLIVTTEQKLIIDKTKWYITLQKFKSQGNTARKEEKNKGTTKDSKNN